MRRGIKQQMTAFNEFLEDKADGNMLPDKRWKDLQPRMCQEGAREALGASLSVGIPRDWAQYWQVQWVVRVRSGGEKQLN